MARVHDYWGEAVAAFLAERLQQREAGGVWQRQIEHHAIECLRPQMLQAFTGRPDSNGFDVGRRQQLADSLPLDGIVFNDEHTSYRPCELRLQPL